MGWVPSGYLAHAFFLCRDGFPFRYSITPIPNGVETADGTQRAFRVRSGIQKSTSLGGAMNDESGT